MSVRRGKEELKNTEQPDGAVQVPVAEIITAMIHEIEAQRKQIKALTDVQRNQALALQRCGERLAMIEGHLAAQREIH